MNEEELFAPGGRLWTPDELALIQDEVLSGNTLRMLEGERKRSIAYAHTLLKSWSCERNPCPYDPSEDGGWWAMISSDPLCHVALYFLAERGWVERHPTEAWHRFVGANK